MTSKIEQLLSIYEKSRKEAIPRKVRIYHFTCFALWLTSFIYILFLTSRNLSEIKNNSRFEILLKSFPIVAYPILAGLHLSSENRFRPIGNKIRIRRLERLKDYIEENGWDNHKLDMLQAMIRDEAEKAKLSFVLLASMVSLLWIPLWSVYLDKIFDCFSEYWQTLNLLFIVGTMVILSIAVLLLSLYYLINDTWIKYGTLKEIDKLISDIRLSQSDSIQTS